MNQDFAIKNLTGRYGRLALVVGVVASGLLIFGGMINSRQFFISYLQGFIYVSCIMLGSSGLCLLHNLTGGKWGNLIRPFLNAGTKTLPLMFLLFIPLTFGLKGMYPWADPEIVAHDPILQFKSVYLNPKWWIIRGFICIAIFNLVPLVIKRLQPPAGEPKGTVRLRRFQTISGFCILVYGLTLTVAMVDWLMSLDAHWFSTMFSVIIFAHCILLTFAFCVVNVVMLRGEGTPLPDRLVMNDLGNFLLMSVMLFAYVGFSQFLLTWSGQLAEEVPYYHARMTGGWQFVGIFLLLFLFFVPFCLLLSRQTKRNLRPILSVACSLLVMGWLYIVWIVEPSYHPGVLVAQWTDIAAPFAVGGIWLFVYFTRLEPWVPAVAGTVKPPVVQPTHTSYTGPQDKGPQDRH